MHNFVGMLASTMATLNINGKFAEIGKRDIWSAQRVATERPDVRYSLVAIDFLPVQVREGCPTPVQIRDPCLYPSCCLADTCPCIRHS